jgi:hypothetical protein
MTKRPSIFKWRQSEPEIILCAVGWYLRYSLSLRDVEELLIERGLGADHVLVQREMESWRALLESVTPFSPGLFGTHTALLKWLPVDQAGG